MLAQASMSIVAIAMVTVEYRSSGRPRNGRVAALSSVASM
jgi:hypothetical protein